MKSKVKVTPKAERQPKRVETPDEFFARVTKRPAIHEALKELAT